MHISLFVFGEILPSPQNLVSRKCSTFLELSKTWHWKRSTVRVLCRCKMCLQARAGAVLTCPILMQELHVSLSHTFTTLHTFCFTRVTKEFKIFSKERQKMMQVLIIYFLIIELMWMRANWQRSGRGGRTVLGNMTMLLQYYKK